MDSNNRFGNVSAVLGMAASAMSIAVGGATLYNAFGGRRSLRVADDGAFGVVGTDRLGTLLDDMVKRMVTREQYRVINATMNAALADIETQYGPDAMREVMVGLVQGGLTRLTGKHITAETLIAAARPRRSLVPRAVRNLSTERFSWETEDAAETSAPSQAAVLELLGEMLGELRAQRGVAAPRNRAPAMPAAAPAAHP